MIWKKGQISFEYLIMVSFIVFLVISFVGIAFYYTSGIQDKIITNQLDNFANKVISSAEGVYFAGEPSRSTITAFLPAGIIRIDISEENGEYYILFEYETNSGTNTRIFPSNVPLETGNFCAPCSEGSKRLQITAQENNVAILQT